MSRALVEVNIKAKALNTNDLGVRILERRNLAVCQPNQTAAGSEKVDRAVQGGAGARSHGWVCFSSKVV